MNSQQIADKLSVDFGTNNTRAGNGTCPFPARRVSGAWWNTKATRPERSIAPAVAKTTKDIKIIQYQKIPNNLIKEYIRTQVPWTYEILFTIDPKKFEHLRVYPSNAQFINKINNFFTIHKEDVRIYGIWELPKKGSSNLHCHAILCIDKKTHRGCRKVFNLFVNKYEKRYGITMSARINKFHENYKPTDKRGTKRYEGNLDKYIKYMTKTDHNKNTIDDSVFIARFNNLL